MPLICVCSPKGGVGKTTVCANLAYTLSRSGYKVLAIDFDVQNALRLHFGMPLADKRGFAAQALKTADWSQFVMKAGSNLFLLPYGDTNAEQHTELNMELAHDPHLLQRGLHTLLNYPKLLLIGDFPPGPGAALKASSPIADLHLVTLLADTASISLLPQVNTHRLTGYELNNRTGTWFVLNQCDSRRKLNQDATQFMQQQMGDQLIGLIHRDESVSEANASQQSILDFNPASTAAFDIELLSKRVIRILDVQVGDGAVMADIKTSTKKNRWTWNEETSVFL